MRPLLSLYSPLFATIGGLLLGYDIGIIGSALLSIQSELHLSSYYQGIIASVVILGIMFGLLISNLFSNQLDKRNLIVAATFVYMLGYIDILFAGSGFTIVLGRIIAGVGIGILLVIVPVYIVETAPTQLRGRYIAAFQLAITFGVVLGYFLSYQLAFISWRWLFAGGLAWATLLISSRLILPKIVTSHPLPKENKTESTINYNYARLFIIGIGITMLQQLTGINAIMYFAPQIFKSLSQHADILLSSLIIAAGNFLFTIISLFILDTIGRRPVLLASLFLQFISLAVLGLISYFSLQGNIVIFIACLLIYIFGYAAGLGPVGWLITSEIYPQSIRTKALALTLFINNIIAFSVTASFLPMLQLLGKTNTFYFYSLMSLFGLIFVWLLVPETKQKSLEEIQNDFMKNQRNKLR